MVDSLEKLFLPKRLKSVVDFPQLRGSVVAVIYAELSVLAKDLNLEILKLTSGFDQGGSPVSMEFPAAISPERMSGFSI